MTLSAGIIVLHRAHDETRYLLLRAYRNWDFPKGMVEPDESPLMAAQRELREETGIDAAQLCWGDVFYETPPYAKAKIARYYLAATNTTAVTLGINPQLGRPEHHEYRWLTYDAAMPLLVPRLQFALTWANEIVTRSTDKT